MTIMPQDAEAVVANLTENEITEYQVQFNTNIQSSMGNKHHPFMIPSSYIHA